MEPAHPFTVGVTGHRPNRMAIGVPRIEARLNGLLRVLGRAARDRRRGRPVAVSALAEGADRLFASAALALGYDLHAVLPFATAEYETTFGDRSDTPAYHALLARATMTRTLPGQLNATKAAYEAVGRATVDASDVMIAVWDGKPAAGRGGTPEIIDYALSCNVPVLWIDAARDRPPRLLCWPSAGGLMAVPLARLAQRSRPFARHRLERLIGGG